MTVRLTMAQALVRFLANQYVERDGVQRRFFAGCFGIFGHGNVAGVGQALLEYEDDLTYYQSRNEQAMVHTAVGYARQRDRLQTWACTASVARSCNAASETLPGWRTSNAAPANGASSAA